MDGWTGVVQTGPVLGLVPIVGIKSVSIEPNNEVCDVEHRICRP